MLQKEAAWIMVNNDLHNNYEYSLCRMWTLQASTRPGVMMSSSGSSCCCCTDKQNCLPRSDL
eukprot:4519292-Pyramimonas_sp.AAC.1